MTNFACESYNITWYAVHNCRLKMIKRNIVGAYFNGTVMYPVNDLTVYYQFFKRANGYKPWLMKGWNAITFKLTNFACESYNKTWYVVHNCRLKMIKRNIVGAYFNGTVMYPVNDMTVYYQFFKRANGYKPWLMKVIQRNRIGLYFNGTVLHPANDISISVKMFKRANGYKPWLWYSTCKWTLTSTGTAEASLANW
ncbi:uncharacterized protein Dwil_GK26781 [Drosophila willistoni]|uniref:Uncharacterized protein n=1 Tax=Drosophila willistoni TaxID=7260 RepID=A0A0Q9WUQ6_DROWI|nr:uncharacterized protein Dwil_GK26781 [Drosophila willistoni]